jgi:hypothetical protein
MKKLLFVFLLFIPAVSFSQIQVINTTTGAADNLKNSFTKVNSNFSYQTSQFALKANLANPSFTGIAKLNTDTMAVKSWVRTLSNSLQTQLNGKTSIPTLIWNSVVLKIGTDTLATRAYSRTVGGGSGVGGSGTWGAITGSLTEQSDLQSALNLKANTSSPSFSGTVTGTFSGNLTGNVTGNVSGNAGTVTNGVYTSGAGTVFLAPNGSAYNLTSFPTLNQNTTGSAATLTTSRQLFGNSFNGSANVTGIIASTYGGTGNGFFKVSGPATTEKTFTFPNANATIARTDAAQTFTGTQTFSSSIAGNITGSAATVTGFNPGSGSLNLSGANAVTLTTNGATNVTLPASGTLASSTGIGTQIHDTIAGGRILTDWAVMKADSNIWDGGYVTPKRLAVVAASISGGTGTGGSNTSKMQFRIGVTTDAPTSGDSVFTQSAFIGKHLELVRNGHTEYQNTTTNAVTGFRLNGSTGAITVRPTFATGDKFDIYVTETSAWSDLTINGGGGGGGTTQNLLLYSEQLQQSGTWETNSYVTVSANQANDVNGSATMDQVTLDVAYGAIDQIVSVSAATNYTLSFDVKQGTQGSAAYYQVKDLTNDVEIVLEDYYSSTSATVGRVSFNFATPSGCTSIRIIPYMGQNTGDNFYIGRVQLAAPGKTYVTTTTTPVN